MIYWHDDSGQGRPNPQRQGVGAQQFSASLATALISRSGNQPRKFAPTVAIGSGLPISLEPIDRPAFNSFF